MRAAAAVSFVLTISSCILANKVFDLKHKIPRLEDFDWKRQVSGLIPNREELMKRPRIIFGYLSEKDWALMEFLCFMHASWRYVTSLAEPTGYRLDLMVFSDPRWFAEVAGLCEQITLVDGLADEKAEGDVEAAVDSNDGDDRNGRNGVSYRQAGTGVGLADGHHGGGGGTYPQLRRQGRTSTCWVVPYPPPAERVWQGYPFVASYHFLADPRVADLLTSNYGYAMKTDFDCFITPTLIQHFPWQLEATCITRRLRKPNSGFSGWRRDLASATAAATTSGPPGTATWPLSSPSPTPPYRWCTTF
ncbi:hypothetical protein Vafri_8513 [Volvox africanus]|nr:hypothetical protein Vafri_8513 [Volvox africanus]